MGRGVCVNFILFYTEVCLDFCVTSFKENGVVSLGKIRKKILAA